MTDLRRRIEAIMREHHRSAGRMRTAAGREQWVQHATREILAVLQPDTDTIDRIAKAICDRSDTELHDWSGISTSRADHFRDLARAAINAWTAQENTP